MSDMVDISTTNAIESKSISLWSRILASLFGIVFTFFSTFYLSFAFAPPDVFIYFIFLSILALSLILTNWGYKNRDNWILYTCVFMIVWIMILAAILPTLTKQYSIAVATKIIPVYSAAKLGEVTYLTYGAFSLGKSVNYQYQTKTPNEDYKKMHDLYITQLGQHGYDVTETTDTSITFQKHNDASPTVFLSISKRYPNTIEVSVDQ